MIDPDKIERIRDEVLVLKYRLGDEKALAALFRRYSAPLKYYVRRIAGTTAADDIAQSAWLEVVRSIGRLRNPVSFRAWLFRMARNKAIRSLGHAGYLTGLETAKCDSEGAVDPLEGIGALILYGVRWVVIFRMEQRASLERISIQLEKRSEKSQEQ